MGRLVGAITALTVMAGLLIALPSAQGVREARFVAAGDFGARTATRTVLDGMAAANPTAALALGDLSYNDLSPESAWCSYVKQSTGEGFPFQLTAGNHETVDHAHGLINNFSACLPNQVAGITGTYGREYFMDFPRTNPLVRVISVSPDLRFEDGEWAYAAGDAHFQWLSSAIDGGRAAGAKWIIVTAHKPCWSVGGYSCPTADFTQLLLEKRVDLVLHGHEHGYMRTHQLANQVSGCATVPTGAVDQDCIRDTDSTFTAGQGTVFATVGTGGIPLRDVSASDTEAGYFAAYSGANSNPAFGFLDIAVGEDSLAAQFVRTSGSSFSDSFTIGQAGAPVNQPPTAAFTAAPDGLSVAFDGSGSQDPDGQIASYAWDFGDGSAAGSGAKPNHTYAAAGTYTVGLTVTDNDGAARSTSKQVAVGQGDFLARDTFSRTVGSGFGAADVGGAWTVSGSSSAYSVDGSSGAIEVAPGRSLGAELASVSSGSTAVSAAFRVTGAVSGGGVYASLAPRIMADGSQYRASVRIYPSGNAYLSLRRVAASGAQTVLATSSTRITGLGDQPFLMRTEAVGTSPTAVRAKFWRVGDAEPSTWQVSVSDSASALQAAGGVGVAAYQSSTGGSTVTVSLDDLEATAP